ncbi:MAG: rod shape-determining protein MreC [Nitrospinota bacterium]
MRQIRHRNRDAILLAALVVCSLTLMTLQVRHRGATTPLERAVMSAIGPFQTLARKPLRAIRAFTTNLATAESLWETNASLRVARERLHRTESALRELRLEHERLRRLLRFRQRSPFKTVAASVIARDATNWSKTITLDVGSRAGLKEDLSVVNHEGIVGHLIRVAPLQSQALLITDARGAVDVLIQRTRTAGVFVGSSNGDRVGYLRYVRRDADVRVSDRVISSGYGGIYPKGIPVGVVQKVDRSGTGMFQRIEVEPAVDFSRIEEVLVVVGRYPGP